MAHIARKWDQNIRKNKIRNVPLDVCCAEQKIAYNIAFKTDINFGDKYRALQTAEEKESMIQKLVEDSLVSYRLAYDYQPGKYNEEGIKLLLQNGLAGYLEKPFIATAYEQIGNTFPVQIIREGLE